MREKPSKNVLRIFSLITTVLGAVLVLYAFKKENSILIGIGVFLGVGMLLIQPFPKVVERAYDYWMVFGRTIGWVNSRVFLMFVFYLVVTPTGTILRILGRRPKPFTKIGDVDSYWSNCEVYRDNHWAQMY